MVAFQVGGQKDCCLPANNLSRIGLIPDHDDDVMDEQKWVSARLGARSSCSRRLQMGELFLASPARIRQASRPRAANLLSSTSSYDTDRLFGSARSCKCEVPPYVARRYADVHSRRSFPLT